VINILLRARKIIVEANHFVGILDQNFAKMGAYEPCTTCDEYSHKILKLAS
jgi:hypothetical protein